MKTSIQQVILMAITSVMAFGVSAHSGHDHSAMSSSAIHAVLYFAIFSVVAFAGYMSFKAISAQKSEK